MSHAVPRQLDPVRFVIGHEALERFAFFGARSILTTYLAAWLVVPDRDAKAAFHLFLMAAYLMPLAGGWLADRFWGRYPTLLRASLLAFAGYVVLALWRSPGGCALGAGLVACGAGGLVPSASAFVGEQAAGRGGTLERVYGWFYWVINLGAAAANLAVPFLLQRFGPGVAFAVPAVAMGAATFVLWRGRGRYLAAPPSGPKPHGFFRVVGRALRRLGTHRDGEHWLDAARDSHPPEAVAGARAVLRILVVFAAVTVFWALFDQTGSSWVLQADRLDLQLGGWRLAPAQLQALNPALVLLLVPLLSAVVLPGLEARGLLRSPLSRMRAGMVATALAYVAAAVLEVVIDAGRAPSVLWQVPQYLLLTTGEVLVSVTGLEFSFRQAPASMRSAIMSIWFLTIFLGNLLTLSVLELVALDDAASFAFFAALMAGAAIAFGAAAGGLLGAGEERADDAEPAGDAGAPPPGEGSL